MGRPKMEKFTHSLIEKLIRIFEFGFQKQKKKRDLMDPFGTLSKDLQT